MELIGIAAAGALFVVFALAAPGRSCGDRCGCDGGPCRAGRTPKDRHPPPGTIGDAR